MLVNSSATTPANNLNVAGLITLVVIDAIHVEAGVKNSWQRENVNQERPPVEAPNFMDGDASRSVGMKLAILGVMAPRACGRKSVE